MAKRKKETTDDLIEGGAKKITNELVQAGGGRPASPETLAQRKQILRLAKKPISNVELAAKLGVTTAKSQSLAKPLVAKGLLTAERGVGRVTYQTVA